MVNNAHTPMAINRGQLPGAKIGKLAPEISHLAFAFRVTPDLLMIGVAFALLMGFVGGVLPAVRASRLPAAGALREL